MRPLCSARPHPGASRPFQLSLPPAFRAWILLLTPALLLMTACGVWPAVAAGPTSAQGLARTTRVATNANATPALAAATESLHIKFSHNLDCDFGCGATLEIGGNGRATLTIAGNQYSKDNPPSLGVFEGMVPPEDLAALVALFRDPLFRNASESEEKRLHPVFRNLSFNDDHLSISKSFTQRQDSNHSAATTALLDGIYTRLDAVRATLFTTRPVLGLTVGADKVRYDPKTKNLEVTLLVHNTGSAPLLLVSQPYITATVLTNAEEYLETKFIPDAQNKAPAAGMFETVAPGGAAKPIRRRVALGTAKGVVTQISWTGQIEVRRDLAGESLRFTYMGNRPYTLPQAKP